MSRVLRWWWAGVRAVWVEIPRSLWVDVVWAARRVGYRVRPYDVLADARRWWWQPRQRCGFARGGVVYGPRGGDSVPFMLSPGEEILTRDRAVEMGLGAAWDAQRKREQGGGRGAG